MATKTLKVLSIEAWRESEGGWTWNQWYNVGTVELDTHDLNNARKVLKALRGEGILSPSTAGKVAIDNDQYNIVVIAKGTREPLYAIEYGTLLS